MTPNSDGYDISHWNAINDPAMVPAFGIVAHKATEATVRDPMFLQRWTMFLDQNIEIMCPYHFLRSTRTIADQLDAYTHALVDVDALDADGVPRQGVLLMTDWEPLTKVVNGASVLIDPVPVDVALEWNAAVAGRFGEREITYSSDWKSDFQQWRQALPDHPLWYSNFHLDGPNGFWAECDRYSATIGQWTNHAVVSGFAGFIDMNHVFDWTAVRRLAGYPQPPKEPTMEQPPIVLTNADVDSQLGAQRVSKWRLMIDGTKRHIPTLAELKALGNVPGVDMTDDELNAIPDYVPPLTSVALQGTVGVSGVLSATVR